MTKYCGIDYGTKKIGVALSDDSGTIAFPHSVIIQSPHAHTQIKEIIETNGVHEVVIGHSKDHDGTENPLMKHVYAFKKELEGSDYVVHLEPEFLTTFQAKRMSEDNVADASAAALILQSFIDNESKGNI